jgi:hypothetical protein
VDTGSSESIFEEPENKYAERDSDTSTPDRADTESSLTHSAYADRSVGATRNVSGSDDLPQVQTGKRAAENLGEGFHGEDSGFDPSEDFFIFPKEDTGDDGPKTRSGGQLSVLPFVSLFAILLFVFSLVTMTYQVDPIPLESLIRRIPWYGPAIFENKQFKHRVELESLTSGFEPVLGHQEVVVVSGKLLNRNTRSVENVQIEAQIYDAKGKPIGKETVYLGNALSSKIIQDMTPREIALLQSLKPENAYRIEPSQAVPFTIVLPKPKEGVSSFSCRVVSAEATA